MRIGLIRMKYSPYGGAEIFLERFINELKRRGHEIDVFSSDWPEAEGIRVHRIRTGGPRFLRPLIFAAGAARAVDKAQCDCVISLERTYCQDIYRAGDGCHREWLARKRAMASAPKRALISMNPLHAALLYLEARLFSSPRLKRVVANSRMVRDDIIRHYGLPKKRICVIYNGFDAPPPSTDGAGTRAGIRSRLGISEETVLLLFVGSGFERKGLIHAIRSLGLLRDKGDVRLLVIGKGATSGYSAEAKRLGVGDRVIFMGPVNGVFEYYGAADVFVLPTLYEPFSNACLEAMAAGLPVITSRANGVSEILTGAGYRASIDEAADTHGLASAIETLLDKDARAKASKAVREIASGFTIGRNVTEFLKLIEEVSTDA